MENLRWAGAEWRQRQTRTQVRRCLRIANAKCWLSLSPHLEQTVPELDVKLGSVEASLLEESHEASEYEGAHLAWIAASNPGPRIPISILRSAQSHAATSKAEDPTNSLPSRATIEQTGSRWLECFSSRACLGPLTHYFREAQALSCTLVSTIHAPGRNGIVECFG